MEEIKNKKEKEIKKKEEKERKKVISKDEDTTINNEDGGKINELGFTSSDTIDNYQSNDITIHIKGYVDDTEDTTTKDGKQIKIFKIHVNNGQGRRVRVLFWGQSAIKYSKMINKSMIVDIRRGKSKKINPKFKSPDIAHVEISFQKFSTIKIDKKKFIKEDCLNNDSVEPVEINLENLRDFKDTKVLVKSWVQVPFQEIESCGNVFGSGSIVNGIWRVCVHISKFSENNEIKSGSYVQIIGTPRIDEDDNVFLLIEDSDDIKLLTKHVVSNDILNEGIMTPKRSREEKNDDNQDEGSSHKKLKFDDQE